MASRAHIGTRDREVKRASGDRSAAPICDGMHDGGCGGLSLPLAWALGAAATSAANIRASAMLFVTIIDSPPPSIVIRVGRYPRNARPMPEGDRKSTRLNSSHVRISYAVFCLKKKKQKKNNPATKNKKNCTIRQSSPLTNQ